MTAPLDRLAAAGFSQEEIDGFAARQAAMLRAGGFSESEIHRWLGGRVSNPEPARRYFRARFEEARAAAPEKDFGFTDAFLAGFEQSVPGLVGKHRELERTGQREGFIEVPEDPGLGKRIARQLGQLTGDVPLMLAGAAIAAPAGGGVGSGVTALGGAFALPAALREMLIHKYEHGEAESWQDFWAEASAAFGAELKGFLTGAATGAAGAAAAPLGGAGRFGLGVVTMTKVGAALEGEVPEPEDFLDAALVLGGAHAARSVAGRARRLYVDMGRTPRDLLRDVARDPSILEDLASKNVRLPRAYRHLEPELRRMEVERLEAELRRQTEFARELAPEAFEGHRDTPVGRILARVSSEPEAPRSLGTWDRIVTEWVDRLHPLGRAVKEMAEGKDVPAIENAYRLARMLPANAARAEHFLRIQPYRFHTLEPVEGVKPLRAILKPVEGQVDALRAYLVSRRALELQGRGIETGVRAEDAEATVARYRKTFEPIARDLDAYQEAVLRYFTDSGILSAEQMAAMRAANAAYVPFYRVLEEGRSGAPEAGGGLTPRQAVRHIRGSERQIVDPLESIIKNTYTLVELAERNRVARTFVEMAEASPAGADFARPAETTRARPVRVTPKEQEKIARKALEGRPLSEREQAQLEEAFTIFRRDALRPGKNQITVFRDGKRELWDAEPSVYEAFEGAGPIHASLLARMLQAPARTLRAGAVLSPEFIARNPVRDQLSAFIFTEHGFRPYLDMARGLYHLAGKTERYAEFERSGGPMATLVSLDRKYLQQNLRELMEAGGLRTAARNVLRSPVEFLRVFSESAEYATRLGVFDRARRSGADPFDAAFESREATLDFNRAGVQGRAVNAYIPFFNASIQGSSKMVRSFREHPVRTTARVLGGVTLPSVALYLVNREQEWYQEAPEWQRDLFWLVSPDGGETVYRIPKPFEVGVIFGTGAERVAERILEDDPRAFDGILETLYRGSFPSVVPTAAAPLIETWANRSIFLDRPLLPARMEKLLPEYQFHPYTTELTKAIGHAVAEVPGLKFSQAASPIVIENAIRSWTGGLGTTLLRLADASLRKAGMLPDPARPSDTLADIPVIRAFVVRHPTAGASSIQEFYERFGREQRVLETVRELAKRGDPEAALRELQIQGGVTVDVRDVQRTLSQMSQLVRMVYRAPDTSPEEKRNTIDALYFRMIEVAKLGNQILDRFEEVRRERAEEMEALVRRGAAPAQ